MALFSIAILTSFVAGPAAFASDATAARSHGQAAPAVLHNLQVPVELVLEAPEPAIGPLAEVELTARVTARTDLGEMRLNATTEGPVALTGSPELVLGPLAAGETVEVSIPVRYGPDGRSAVHVGLLAAGTAAHLVNDANLFERNEALYCILRDGVARTGMGGFLRLELRAVEEDYLAGRLTEDEARSRTRELQAPPVTHDREPRTLVPLTPEQRSLSEALRPVARPGETPAQLEPVLENTGFGTAGTVTVQGTVSWLDENGTVHPAFGMTVEVRDDELIGSELVDFAATNVNGQYSFVVNNNDGPLQNGRDIFVRFRTANSAISIETAGLFGGPYEAESPQYDDVADGTVITENLTCANTGTGPSCGLTTGASYVASYAAALNGGAFLNQIVLEWPGDAGSANYDGSDINLRPGDQWDWDVMFHEYGHYVMDEFNFENNPGGPHNLGDCISDVQSSKSKGVRLAWGEGWPTFFGTVGQQMFGIPALNIPRVGDINYADTGESNFSYSLEAQDNLGLGEDNELAVQRILWDLWDGNSDGRDTVSVSDQSLFDTMDAADPTTLSAAWAAVRGPLSNEDDLAYGAITTDHFVGPRTVSPAAAAVVSPGNASFSWARDVGCSTTFDGDGFTLRFYDADTFSNLLNVGGLGGISTSLSSAQIDTLAASGHDVLWAVEGSNSDSPATGPYLGESRAIIVDRPPVASAGADQAMECTGPGNGTTFAVDGCGSSDPDGDALDFAWSSGTCTFGDATACATSADCPFGSNTISLTASDPWLDSAPDDATLDVDDTTPPEGEITFPANGDCVGASVTILDNFSDICDDSLDLTYVPGPGPTYTTHGDHHVTVTAEDDGTNTVMDDVSFTIDTVAPTVVIQEPPAQGLIPDIIPFNILFVAADDDMASGGVTHERVFLDGCLIYDGNTHGDADGLLSDESLPITVTELCRISDLCGFTSLNQPVFSVEATDCGGNSTTTPQQLSGSVALRPGVCGF